MFITLLFFVLILSVVVAEMEIQIEGKNGWANKLPTWRVNNKVTLFILGPYHPLTGYHFFLSLLVMLFFHFPFFIGLPWTLSFELKILASFFFFWMVEDFLWFIFNRNFGLSKFKKGEIPWHTRWLFGIPYSYYKFFLLSALLYFGSFFIK